MRNTLLFLKKMTGVLVGLWLMASTVLASTATAAEVIYNEPFSTSFGAFKTRSLAGDQTWQWDKGYGAKMSGYVSPNAFDNEDWLISPSMDLTHYKDIILNFNHVHRYAALPEWELQLWVTDTYLDQAGDTAPLPSLDTTRWIKMPFTKADQASWTFIPSGPVSLDAFAGKSNVRFAFRYLSSTVAAATWEIKDIVVNGVNTNPSGETGGETGTKVVVLAESFDKAIAGTPASPSTTDIATQLNAFTEQQGWTGTKIYQAGGMLKFGSSSVTGSLSTPALDLSADSGYFEVSFKAMAWSLDSTRINILLNGNVVKEVTGLPNTPAYTLASFGPYRIFGGTASSVLTFTGLNTAKTRFYLDSLVITQIKDTTANQPPLTPEITASPLSFRTETGHSLVQPLWLSGKALTGQYKVELHTITHPEASYRLFSTQTTVISAEQLMAGYGLSITYSPIVAGVDSAYALLYSPEHPEPYRFLVTGTAYSTTHVPNLRALRQAYEANPSDESTIYRVSDEVVVTYAHPSGNSKYVQDATAGMMIYDTKRVLDSIYVGNGLTGLTGTFDTYGGMTELIPSERIRPSSYGHEVKPVKLTIATAKEKKERYESMLVQLDSLTNISGKHIWGTSKANYAFTDGKDTLVIRTNDPGLDYMNDTIPTVPTNYAGLLIEFNGTVQLFPRNASDIGVAGGTLPNDTVTPPDTTTTVSMSGGSCQIGEVVDLFVEAKGYSLTDNYISYQFDLNYDPTLLGYEGAWDTDLTNGPHGALVINNPAPGLLRFSYMQTYPFSGNRSLLMIRFKGLKVGDTQPTISHFLFNTDTVKAVMTAPVIIEDKLVYLPGDVDGNGFIQAYDAALTLQYSVNMEPLPGTAPRPWAGWRLKAADADNSGSITAFDAANILRWSAGLIDTFLVTNPPTLRSATVDETNVIITQENDKLVFTATGQLIGFNLYAGKQHALLGTPTLLDNNLLSAMNRTDDFYAIGLAKALAFEPGKPFMTIPVTTDSDVSLELLMVINAKAVTQTTKVTTGLDKATHSPMTVYPNPVKSTLTIQGLTPGSTVGLYNLNGLLLMEKTVLSHNETWEMNALPAGVYVLKNRSIDGETRIAKVLKQ